ncbi:hypothetical protein F5Y01DRAFT_326840 [Xylaria sp. FL0043]|nr:hypothetical protein F5Y01DRAFT_326840 [Xylaria sp. FL0043]
MAPITKLPCELIVGVFRELDNESLLSSILTCRHFYLSYKEYPSLPYQNLRRQVGSALLPYAAAVAGAPYLASDHSSVDRLLNDLYNEPDNLASLLKHFPLTGLIEVGRTHDLVKDFADAFAQGAWNYLSPSCQEDVVLSSTEKFRFYRGFYRVELFFRLFRSDSSQLSDELYEQRVDSFFSRHPPWINEQLGCVHDYLEKRFSGVVGDALRHDIAMGNLSMNALNLLTNRPFNESGISQGMDFIHKLESASSHEERLAMLKPVFTACKAELRESLIRSCISYTPVNVNFEHYSEADLDKLVPREDDEDTDEGPFTAWEFMHYDLPSESWVLLEDFTFIRECAYVFWDEARIEEHQLLRDFEEFSLESDSIADGS